MIDIVIPLGTGSHHDNIELLYSLRSLEKHVTFDKVWIVGELPRWVKNVNHIPFPDDPKRCSDYNIMNKITVATMIGALSEDFLFMNDDHFFLQPMDASKMPYYYCDTLQTFITHRGLDTYGRRVKNTLKLLLSKNLPTKYFDIHYPIIYNKSLFLNTVTNQDWTDPFIIKSLYCNSLNIEGEFAKDNKLNDPPRTAMKVFSTMPRIKGSILQFLRANFPTKSRFE